MPNFKFSRIYTSSQIDETLLAKHVDKIREIFSGLRPGANFEKLTGFRDCKVYSARGSDAVRYLCVPHVFPHESSFAIIAILENHNYQDCRKEINESRKSHTTFTPLELGVSVSFSVLATLTSKPPALGAAASTQMIFLSGEQERVLDELGKERRQHRFINGIAGSGKTTIAQYLLQGYEAEDRVLYLCPHESLATAQRNQYQIIVDNQGTDLTKLPTLEFKSIREFYRECDLLKADVEVEDFSWFRRWINHVSDKSHPLNKVVKKFKDQEQLYSEFKAILNLHELDIKKYRELPVSLSLFEQQDEVRGDVFELYQSYLNYLREQDVVCLEKVKFEFEKTDVVADAEVQGASIEKASVVADAEAQCASEGIAQKPRYTQILIDETQLFPYQAIKQLADLSDRKLILFGDFNQGRFHFRSHKLAETLESLELEHLDWNFRCSEPVVEFANVILRLQRSFIGGEFESHSVRELVHKRLDKPEHAHVRFMDSSTTQQLPIGHQAVFITRDEETKSKLIKSHPEQIFTVLLPEQVCGLEFDDIILYDLIGQDFESVAKHLRETSADEKHGQPADKREGAKRLKDIAKFRRLFLAITRAKNTICWVEDSNNAFVATVLAATTVFNAGADQESALTRAETASISKPQSAKDADAKAMLHYDGVVRLLNSEEAFEEGLRQIQQYLEKIKSQLIQDVLASIKSIRKQNGKFTTEMLIDIIKVKSKNDLISVIRSSGNADIMSCYAYSLLEHFKTAKPEEYDSLYRALAVAAVRYGLTHDKITQKDIKSRIFNSLPVTKTPDKTKGKTKGVGADEQRVFFKTQVSRTKYMDRNDPVSADFREYELENFAKQYNVAIIIFDPASTSKRAIEHYNSAAQKIIILQKKQGNTFDLIPPAQQKFLLIKEMLQNQNGDKAHDVFVFELALKYNLVLQQSRPDGHCFYHSIAAFAPRVNDQVQGYQALRNLAADEISNNPSQSGIVDEALEAYLIGVRGNKWGGQPETAALSQRLNCPIIVFSKDFKEPWVHGQGLPNPPIFLYYNGTNHYDSLMPRADARAILAKIVAENPATPEGRAPVANPCTLVPARLAEPEKTHAKTKVGSSSSTIPCQGNDIALMALVKSSSPSSEGAAIEYIKKHKMDVDSTDEYGNTVLFYAVGCKKTKLVDYLLGRGARIDCRGPSTVVHAAAEANLKEMIELFIKHKVTFERKNITGDTPLLYAIDYKHRNLAIRILEQTKEINHINKNGMTALMLAIYHGLYDVATALIDKGADVTITINSRSALLDAVKRGTSESEAVKRARYDLVKRILSLNPDINAVDSNGNSALLIAMMNRDYYLAEQLLSKGTVQDIDNKEGACALAIAIQDESAPMVRLLIQHKFDVNRGSSQGDFLSFAAAFGTVEIMRILIEAGAILNGDTECSPLIIAIEKENMPAAQLLLDKGANVNHVPDKSRYGMSPLHYAVKINNKNSHRFVKLLLEKGADVEYKSLIGINSLTRAAASGRRDIIDLILSYRPTVSLANLEQPPDKLSQEEVVSIRNSLVYINTKRAGVLPCDSPTYHSREEGVGTRNTNRFR